MVDGEQDCELVVKVGVERFRLSAMLCSVLSSLVYMLSRNYGFKSEMEKGNIQSKWEVFES